MKQETTQRVTTVPSSKRRLYGAFSLIAVLCFCLGGAGAAESTGVEIESARDTLEKWVETRRIISKEKSDWDLGKSILEERIELIQHEIKSLREKIQTAEESISKADKERVELIEKNDQLKSASESLRAKVVKLEDRTRELLPRLPQPLREHLRPLSQRLPEDPETAKLSLGERYQNVIGILNEINKSNREITVHSEVRELPDGTSAEVTALYIGIGQGYYASANGKIAGIGAVTEKGWTWTPANDVADAILRAIAILKNEQVAAFVQLPIEIR